MTPLVLATPLRLTDPDGFHTGVVWPAGDPVAVIGRTVRGASGAVVAEVVRPRSGGFERGIARTAEVALACASLATSGHAYPSPARGSAPGYGAASALRAGAGLRVGQEEPVTPQEQRFIDRVRAGLREVTPTLIFVGAGTGFALAVGSGLGNALMSRLLRDRDRKGDG